MYTAYIGNRFLKMYNQKHKASLTNRQFFDSVLWPLYYNHEKYLLEFRNASFSQNLGEKKKSTDPSKDRRAKLTRFHEYIDAGRRDYAVSVGSSAKDFTKNTSGQVTSISMPFTAEDCYASWIGCGLGIGVEGGWSIYLDDRQIMDILFQGWARYRRALDETPDAKGNQIHAWNGHWLYHHVKSPDPDREVFQPFARRNDGTTAINAISWIKLILALCRLYPNRMILGHICALQRKDNTNGTLGFIQFKLPEIQRLRDVYSHLFGAQGGLTVQGLDDLYATQLGFEQACENGIIGLRQIEPAGLGDFIYSLLDRDRKTNRNHQTQNNFNIYISWIIAMLNNDQMKDVATKAAQAILEFQRGETRRTTRDNAVKELFEAATSPAKFLEELNNMYQEDAALIQSTEELVDTVHQLHGDREQFKYFVRLCQIYHNQVKSATQRKEK